jgi:biopolymer transport protein ExbD
MQQNSGTPEYSEIAKIKVDQAGTIYLNGNSVSIQELKHEFKRLKQVNGAVWYYRDNPQGEPHPKAVEVIKAVVDEKLPVRLMERDFDM